MRGWIVGVVFLASCMPPPRTASEWCYRQANSSRMSRAFGGRQDPTADALEGMRCDQLARDEREQERERSQIESEAERKKAVERLQTQAREAAIRELDDTELALVRASPRAPDLGSTIAEASVMCEQQRGSFAQQGKEVRCRVGGPIIFSGTMLDGRMNRVDVYFEGGDISRARANAVARMGEPKRETISDDGFRVFGWDGVELAMYPKGYRITLVR